MKNVGTENKKPKARYVSQVHKDKEKPFIVYNITTLRQSSIKIIVSTAAVRNFRLFSHDVTQAYLQSDEEMSPEIYLRPKEEDWKHFRVTGDVLHQVLRAFYGVKDTAPFLFNEVLHLFCHRVTDSWKQLLDKIGHKLVLLR